MGCDFSLYSVLGRYLSDGAHAVDRQVKVAYLSIVSIPSTLRHSIACRPKQLPCLRSTFALLSARCAFGYRAPRDLRVVVSHRVRLVAPALQPARARPGLSLPVLRVCAPPTRERRRSSGIRPPAQHTSSGIRHLSRQLCHLPGRRAPDALRVFQPTNLSWLACTTTTTSSMSTRSSARSLTPA